MQKAIDKMALVTTACGATLCLCDSMVIALKRTKGLLYRWPRELNWRSIEGLGEGGLSFVWAGLGKCGVWIKMVEKETSF